MHRKMTEVVPTDSRVLNWLICWPTPSAAGISDLVIALIYFDPLKSSVRIYCYHPSLERHHDQVNSNKRQAAVRAESIRKRWDI